MTAGSIKRKSWKARPMAPTTPLLSLLAPGEEEEEEGEEGGRRESSSPNANVANVPILNVTIVSFRAGYASHTVQDVRVVPTRPVARP